MSKNVGEQVRDGQLSNAWLLYNGSMQIHIEPKMKRFLKTTDCRRTFILSNFEDRTVNVQNLSAV